MTDSKYLSRKWILSMLVVLSSTLLFVFFSLPATIYASTVVAALTVYNIANVTQKGLE